MQSASVSSPSFLFSIFFHAALLIKPKVCLVSLLNKVKWFWPVIIVPKELFQLDLSKPVFMKGNLACLFFIFLCALLNAVYFITVCLFVYFWRMFRALDRKRQKNKNRRAAIWPLGLRHNDGFLMDPDHELRIKQSGWGLLNGPINGLWQFEIKGTPACSCNSWVELVTLCWAIMLSLESISFLLLP